MIRPAVKEDIDQVIALVWIVLEDMELPLLKQASENRLKALMKEAMLNENYRYSYRRAIVCLRDGNIAGTAFGYKGELEPEIDQAFIEVTQAAGLEDGHLFQDTETHPGEWYLDTLVTDAAYRGQGVATELLAALPEIAKAQGETLIGLNCDQKNQPAKHLYQKAGYQKVGECTLSGTVYDHMQLSLT